MLQKKVILSPIIHKEASRIKIEFNFDKEIDTIVRNLNGRLWSKTLGCWHIENSNTSINNAIQAFKEKAIVDFQAPKQTFPEPIIENKLAEIVNPILTKSSSKNYSIVSLSSRGNKGEEINNPIFRTILKAIPPPQIIQRIKLFKEWMQVKRYSENTIETYADVLNVFFFFFKDKNIEDITNDDVLYFNKAYILEKKLSVSYQRQFVNALKLFYSQTARKKLVVDELDRPKKEKKLPNVLSKQDVQAILKVTPNIKHKAALSLIYACGLRRSELLNLKMNDIDSKRNLLLIKQAKGKKDRVAPLPDKVIELLREYYKHYKPKEYLFEGWVAGEKYSEKSLEQVLKKSLNLAKIKKPVSLHWLRHSYATHLLENGTDLRYIQEILGHKSSRTTEIYTHVSTKQLVKIKSPIDDFAI